MPSKYTWTTPDGLTRYGGPRTGETDAQEKAVDKEIGKAVITSAALAGTMGVTGTLYELADGPNAGAKLTWAIPAGESTPTWCWWLWPQSAYTA